MQVVYCSTVVVHEADQVCDVVVVQCLLSTTARLQLCCRSLFINLPKHSWPFSFKDNDFN